MAQLCLWTKIRTKQWLVLGASAFQCMRAGFLCPKYDNFACLHTGQDQNELHLRRWFFFFFAKIGIFCKSIVGPLSEAKTHWMINWLQLLNRLNIVWHHTKQGLYAQFVSMMSPKYSIVENDGELMLMRFTHTFFHSSNILGYTHCFWLFTLWFIYEDASFFHLFHKITNIRSWRCFSASIIPTQFSNSFCNISMIFKVMSQYFPALFKRIHNHIRWAEG